MGRQRGGLGAPALCPLLGMLCPPWGGCPLYMQEQCGVGACPAWLGGALGCSWALLLPCLARRGWWQLVRVSHVVSEQP